METKIDNSLVTVSWQQITEKVEQIHQLKNDPNSLNDLVALTNALSSLLLSYSVSKNVNEKVANSKRVAIVMPTIYKSNNIANTHSSDPIVESISNKENTIHIVNTNEDKETTVEAPVEDSISKIKEMEEDNTVKKESIPIKEEENPSNIAEQKQPEKESNIDEAVSDIYSITNEQQISDEKNSNSEIVDDKSAESEQAEKISADEIPTEEPTEPVIENTQPVQENKKSSNNSKQYSIWESFSANEIPTLVQQEHFQAAPPEDEDEPVKEKNIYNTVSSSAPIKDLKKAISISDRYLFINELFRGEEASYERSLKTINNFNVFQEAQFWIERELKVKLGWDDKSPAVKQFDALVQRRFS